MENDNVASGLLLFTDFHAHLFTEFAKPDPTYYTDRFKQQMILLEGMLYRAKKDNLGIIFGGDLFHKRGAVDVRVFNKVYEIFARYSKDIPFIYLVRGNHDSFDNSMGSPSSLDTFKYLDNVEVISNPESRVLVFGKEDKQLGLYTAFMPYGEDIPTMKEQLKAFAEEAKAKTDLASLLVAHIGIDGAKQGKSAHRLANAFELADLSPDIFNLVYLGHYHLRQNLASNVFYGGSTMQLTFNDEGQVKGYDVLDPFNNEIKFYKSETSQFITITKWDEEAKKLAQEGNFLRVQLPEEEAKKLLEEDKEQKGDLLATSRLEVQNEYELKTRMDIKADNTPTEITKQYTDKFYPEVQGKALDLIREVQND